MKHDLTGKRFNRLVVLSLAYNIRWFDYWRCVCDCGNIRTVRWDSLVTKKTTSCGCYSKDVNSTHGMTKTPEFRSWQSMIQRCCNPKADSYPYYGARDIRVCKRWIGSFKNFLSDMGKKPSPKHSLDRKNVDKNYSPSNCRWATSSEQMKNRRPYSEWGKK